MDPPVAADTGFEQLPESVLVAILRRVPQRDRLAACARVSTAWAAAAAAASADVVCSTLPIRDAARRAEKLAALQAWLDRHSHHVVCLDVAGLSVALPSGAPLQALRSVKLAYCELPAASLAVLQRPQLTALVLESVTVRLEAGKSIEEQALTALLQAQPRLSMLHLHDMQLKDAVLAPLSSMRQLQELSIDDDSAGVTPHRVVGLCSHLTSLELSLHDGARLAASPSAQLPPCLVSLSLTSVQLEPAVLGGLTKLEQLELKYCSLLPAQPPAYRADPEDVAAGTAALMAALVQLKRLRCLSLYCTDLVALDEQQLRAFSALTASSQLSSLVVSNEPTQPLPRGALQHMLPPGRVLRQLLVLQLECLDHYRDGFEADAWCVDAADVASISTACASLQTLELHGVVRGTPEAASSLGGLRRLRQLLELCVGDSTGWLTNDAAAALARISSVRELEIVDAPLLSDVGLQHLTALRQLRSLAMYGCSLSAQLASPGDIDQEWSEDDATGEVHLRTNGKAAAPDVAQQLEALLANSAAVQSARRMSELEAKAARVAELEAQLSEAQRELASKDAELQELRGAAAALVG